MVSLDFVHSDADYKHLETPVPEKIIGSQKGKQPD